MMRAIGVLGLALMIAGPAGSARASEPDLIATISWLESVQNVDGSWGEVWFSQFRPTTQLRDTESVLVGLLQWVGGASGVVQLGSQWLDEQVPISTDFRARRIRALAMAALDVEGDVSELLALREAAVYGNEGFLFQGDGWGADIGHERNALDTALAIRGLEASGKLDGYERRGLVLQQGSPAFFEVTVPSAATSLRVEIVALTGGSLRQWVKPGSQPLETDPFFITDVAPTVLELPAQQPLVPGSNWVRLEPASGTVTTDVIISWQTADFDTKSFVDFFDFLKSAQNGDGGFGVQPGANSHLMTSMHVLWVMGQARERYDVGTAIALGVSYLQGFQDGSGAIGFELGSPTARETALGKISFRAIGETTSESLAADALVGMQDAAGHWDNDPYTTGLALQALTPVPEPEVWCSVLAGGGLLRLLARRRSGANHSA